MEQGSGDGKRTAVEAAARQRKILNVTDDLYFFCRDDLFVFLGKKFEASGSPTGLSLDF